MKTVISPEAVAHAWANSTQSEARNSNRSFYFSGRSIYSYGSHFEIARHVEHEGHKAILFTLRTYSVTTAQHIAIAKSAASHKRLIFVPDPSQSIHDNLEGYFHRIKSELSGLAKARKPEKYIEPAKRLLGYCTDFCEFYKIEVPEKITELVQSAIGGQYKEYLIKEAERIAAEKKEAEEKRMKAYLAQVKKWKAGKIQRIYDRLDKDFLRVNGDKVETSQNIQIPVEVAKRMYRDIQTALSGGKPVKKILDYEVKKLDKSGLQVGCHAIEMKEIERVVKLIS